MSDRYENTQTNISKKNNKQVYKTTIYEKIKQKDTDMYFIAQSGDRLDNLAQRFYKNAALWTYIARVNNLKTMNVPAGTSLRIPTLVI